MGLVSQSTARAPTPPQPLPPSMNRISLMVLVCHSTALPYPPQVPIAIDQCSPPDKSPCKHAVSSSFGLLSASISVAPSSACWALPPWERSCFRSRQPARPPIRQFVKEDIREVWWSGRRRTGGALRGGDGWRKKEAGSATVSPSWTCCRAAIGLALH